VEDKTVAGDGFGVWSGPSFASTTAALLGTNRAPRICAGWLSQAMTSSFSLRVICDREALRSLTSSMAVWLRLHLVWFQIADIVFFVLWSAGVVSQRVAVKLYFELTVQISVIVQLSFRRAVPAGGVSARLRVGAYLFFLFLYTAFQL